MIIGRTRGNLIFIQTSIFVLRSITPLSFLFLIIVFLLPNRFEPSKYISIYPLIEVLFYLGVFLPRKYHLQLPAQHPPILFRNERREFYQRAIHTIGDPERFLSKWFNDAPLSQIKRDNVKEFYRWSFFNTRDVHEDTEPEVDEAVTDMEAIMGRRFEPGYGTAKCLRLTLDEVPMLHRPFVFYMGIQTLDLITHIYLQSQGYQFHRSSFLRSSHNFPPRPQVFTTKYKSPSAKLTYWFRPQTSSTKRPVVFLHGIGIGLGPYFKLLRGIAKEENEGEGCPAIIAIEILPITSRMCSPVLTAQRFCLEMDQILAYHGIEDFVLVSHSYGSVLTSQLLRYTSISSRITSIVMMDPVTLLLFLPDVAYNFVRRKPTLANEHELFYFASRDMGISSTLSRHFFWYENIVTKDDLLYRPGKFAGEATRRRTVTVAISGLDLIVNAQAVAAYLTCPEFPEWDDSEGCIWYQEIMKRPSQRSEYDSLEGQFRLMWYGDLDHAQMLLSTPAERLTREVLARASIKTEDMHNGGEPDFI